MAFWGVEVRPGKPYTHSYDPDRGRLRLCQATLGIGAAIKKSLVQCNVGRKSPVFLCALLPDKTESCHLDLEFEESEEVIFSVIGPRSVHLTGYFSANGHKRIFDDNSESFGEDIANSESYNSGNSSADKYEDSFIDDDNVQEVLPLPDPDDAGLFPCNDEGTKNEAKPKRRLKRKYQVVESDEDVGSKQARFEITKESSGTEIEDEDNVPLSTLLETKMSGKGEKAEMCTNATNDILLMEEANVTPTKEEVNVTPKEENNGLHLNVEKNEHTVTGLNSLHSTTVAMDELVVTETNGESDRRRKSPKKRKRQLDTKEERTTNDKNKDVEALQHELPNKKSLDAKPIEINANSNSEDDKEVIKTKKRKRKIETKGNKLGDDLSETMTLSSGLIIEELHKGKHDGKIAAPGKKVKIFLTAKLRDTGRVFYSNIDKSAHRFVIGSQDVIDGLHIGMDGMREGGKRRLTIPPSLGFGSLGGGKNIPPDSWLVYEVELVGVRG